MTGLRRLRKGLSKTYFRQIKRGLGRLRGRLDKLRRHVLEGLRKDSVGLGNERVRPIVFRRLNKGLGGKFVKEKSSERRK